ncbi:MAG: hypothetical protein KatS3mg121_0944 [Gammaproteobacteria bacterium]|nr:MAG: hypothetical protein KatS3mg121_0944 [Gammaproteobacteria bacterium]
MNLRLPPKRRLWPWLLWLGVFYSVWTGIVLAGGHGRLLVEHWPIALAMALGSYVAGSTPMGGGTVGFPVLVLGFGMPAGLGRDFSFAIQSIGMVSASIFILARRQPLAWAILGGALFGVAVGTPLGLLFVAPKVPDLWVKVLFSVLWAGFGLLHLLRLDEIAAHQGMVEFDERWDRAVGAAVGLVAGATAVAVTGVGVDMLLYTVLVLLCRADLKIAIPTSVVVMAFASVVGVLVRTAQGGLLPEVFGHWLAAAPVVALGAPLGVFVVERVGRKPTLLFVALLCVWQFLWLLWDEWRALGWTGAAAAVAAVAVLFAAFEKLNRWGALFAGERREAAHHRRLPPLHEEEG